MMRLCLAMLVTVAASSLGFAQHVKGRKAVGKPANAAAQVRTSLAPNAQILFIGNSHTAMNNVPEQVGRLLFSDGFHVSPTIRFDFVSLLSQAGDQAKTIIKSRHWDAVILQGAPASSSHKFHYSQQGPISLANLALSQGARVLLFVEWPRRGWDESDFQMNVYKETKHAAPKSELVPICLVWDRVRAKENDIDLWQSDGNHAAAKGSYLAACTLYRFLVGNSSEMPSWIPDGIDSEFAATCAAAAKEIWSQSVSGKGYWTKDAASTKKMKIGRHG